MKKRLTSTFIVFSVLVLFVLGAQQQGCNQKQSGPAFNTTGLTLSFVDQAPMNVINLGTAFPIYLRAENNGGYDIETGTARFYLTGIGNNLNNVNALVLNQNKISKENQQQDAGFEIVKFAENAEPAVMINNPFNFSMRADACYTYATQIQSTICVGQGDSMCSITGEKITTGSNTNAPIQVTSLTEQIQGNKLYISFLIQNKGIGDVYYSDLDCDKFFGFDSSERTKQILKKNFVEIYVDTGTEQDLKCNLQSSSGGLSQNNVGMAPVGTKVTCSKIVGQQTYPAALKINLLYKYINGVSKTITLLP